MKKAILLLHGFKRNDVDDFEEVHEFINTLGAEKVYNEIWFDNYDKETLNLKHLDKRVQEIADKINADAPEELVIIAYSTGTIIGSMVKEKLNTKNVQFIGVAPTLAAHILKWKKTLKNMKVAEKELREKLGEERYERLKKLKEDQQATEKYPVTIIFFMWRKVIGKRKKALAKIKGASFLIATDDHIVKTNKAIKVLKKNNKITVKDFTHDLIVRKEKDIFIEFVKENYK